MRFKNQFNFLLYIDVHSVKLMKFIICILEQIECVLSLALDNACMAWQRKWKYNGTDIEKTKFEDSLHQ